MIKLKRQLTLSNQNINPLQIYQLLISFLLVFMASTVLAIQPTAQQIEQFKQLSPAEQSRLAKQLGISLPQGMTSSADTDSAFSEQEQALKEKSVQKRELSDASEKKASLTDNRLETELDEPPLKAFGYDLFAGSPTTFEPVHDVPVSSDYLLGPGDSLKVNLYGKQSQFFELSIDQEGQSYIPDLGPISLAGLSFTEAKEKIVKTIDQKMIGVKASVSMGKLRSIRVFVLGEAYRPGSYIVSALSTITNALVLSGGISELGSLRHVQLKRQGKLIQTLDLYDLLLKGDTRNDAQLKSGDVVFIPPVSAIVGIKGEVRRPAYYELKAGESIQDLVAFSGGLLPSAYPSAATIKRILKQGDRTLINIDLTQVEAAASTLELQSGDIVDFPKVLEKVRQVVTLSGHIERPQAFTWSEGLYLSQLVPSVDYLKPKPDLDYALIKRYQMPNRSLKIETFSLKQALSAPTSAADPLLQDQDEVIFFSKLEADREEIVTEIVEELSAQASINESVKTVSILGDVRFPGDYPLVKDMLVADLIAAAGGLTERAFQLYAELNRTEIDQEQALVKGRVILDLSSAQSLQVSLKSRDMLQIKTIPNWAEAHSVTLKGEVRFPGVYSINKDDTLADVIERAGGLTEYAYAPGAMFSRVALKEQQAEQLTEMQERLEADIAKAEVVAANQSSASGKTKDLGDAQKVLDQLKNTEATGRLVIDLDKVINQADEYVIALENGDELFVPRKKNSVTIVGEVQLPISQVYESRLSYQDYIKRSGGLTNKADAEKIYIIKANGSVLIPNTSNWFASNQQTLDPGDTIVVPLDAEKLDQVMLWRDMTQIFYQIALGAAAVGSL